MGQISFLREKVKKLLRRRNFPYFIFAAFLLFTFIANTLHESYPDEFDNILGGWYILQGKIIYLGFFTHHGPFPYYLAALVEIFSGRSFVLFRIFYSIFLFLFILGTFKFLRSSVKSMSFNFYLIFIFLFGIGATYFWGHMLLADNISAILITPVFALIMLKVYLKEFFSTKDFVFISVLTFLAFLSSLTYIYIFATIYIFLAFYYLYSYDFKFQNVFNKQTYKIIAIFLAPYALFLGYLLITRSFSDYLYQAIVFNKKYYVYYPGSHGEVTANPIRFAIIIAQNFYNNFSSLLIQAKDFNFLFPFNTTLAVVNTSLIIYLIMKRRFGLAILVWAFLSFANGRSNPMTSSETDYQSAVYILISIFNLSFLIPTLYSELNKELKYSDKLILSLLFFVVALHSFFNFTFLLRKFTEKTYNKYMGFAPLIYDRPRIAPIINSIVDKNSFAWIGPFEFEELFYLNAKVPSKYQILLPAFGSSEKIQQEMLYQFNQNKSDVIYFDKRYFILGRSPEMYGQFFLSYLGDNYTTLYGYRQGKKTFKSKLPTDNRIDLETRLYIRKDRFDQIKNKLLSRGLIEEQ